MSNYYVSTTSQLSSALVNASAGDQILLASGSYGDIAIRDLSFTSGVTITAEDPARPPVFNTISLWKCDNLTFDGIDIKFTPTAETVDWSTAFRADLSSGITVLNSTITGGPAVAGIDPDSEPGTQGASGIMGLPIGNGMNFLNCSGVTIQNVEISEFGAGVRVSNVDGFNLINSEIFHVRKVPVGGADVDNVMIAGNNFHDLVPWKLGGLGDHGDFVHFWTSSNQIVPSDNIVIRDNFFSQPDGQGLLGIFLESNADRVGYTEVLVENNVILNGSTQGMLFEDVAGMIIRANTLLQSGNNLNPPVIKLVDGVRDVLIENNILPGISGSALANAAMSGISIVDNMQIQFQDVLAKNYAGDLFLNQLCSNPTLADLVALPGSLVDGYGAAATQFGSLAGSPSFIGSVRGEGLDLDTHVFAVFQEGSTGIKALASDALVTWSFGDGTQAVGPGVVHEYDHAGLYVATATVALADGTSYTAERVVRVLSPVALKADFDYGLVDQSDIPQVVTTQGTVELVSSEFGQSVRLTGSGSVVRVDATEEMLTNPEFTISVDFKKDTGNEGASGKVLYFSGTAVLHVTADGVTLSGSTSAKESIYLQAKSLGLQDSDWHRVTYTFSQADGAAVLYVDNKEVARMDGLVGQQFTTSGHDLYLGDPFGTALPGLIDNVTFLRGALTAEQVASGYLDGQLPQTSPSTPVATDETYFLNGSGGTLDGGLGLDTVVAEGSAAASIDLSITTTQSTGYGAYTISNFENAIGGSGNDKLGGQSGANILLGREGNDILMGRGGNDRLEGSAGDDTLDGGEGSDQVLGGDGIDSLILDAGDDTLDGGLDLDWLRVTGSAGATIKLAMTTAQSTGYGSDVIKGIENVAGGSGADTILGDQGKNILLGGEGNDTVEGLGGDDSLDGGTGNDQVLGGDGSDLVSLDAGDDAIDGGAGTDWLGVTGSAAATINLAMITAQATGYGLDIILNIENLVGGTGSDVFDGNEFANILLGGEGDDTIQAHGGNDVLEGGAGNDYLNGGLGDDHLLGGEGSDILILSGGNDTLNGGAGIDWLRVVGTTNATIDLALGTAQATGYGTDTILGIENVAGGSGDNKLYGDASANGLRGNSGADLLQGCAGADTLVGGMGKDTLYGGADQDRDVFVFASSAESAVGNRRDVISDFSGPDVVNLSGIDANSRLEGDQAFGFTGTTATAYSIWYVATKSGVIVRSDLNGDARADFEVLLAGVRSLTADEFVL